MPCVKIRREDYESAFTITSRVSYPTPKFSNANAATLAINHITHHHNNNDNSIQQNDCHQHQQRFNNRNLMISHSDHNRYQQKNIRAQYT